MVAGPNDRLTDSVLRQELRHLNSHLPKERRTLNDLLKEPQPTVTSVSGHSIRMKKEELSEMSHMLPEEISRRVRLPIVLLRRRDLGTGAFTVLGDRYEEYAALLLAGSVKRGFDDFKREASSVTIYKPQVSELLRKFHSLIVIGFGSTGLAE